MAQTTGDTPLTIDYATIRELASFQEQYDRLTGEIQQARVQLENSPPLEPGSPGADRREEWRLWLQLQIRSRQHIRDDLKAAIRAKNIVVEHLPE
ncbi:hypothetical protein [Desulfobulbus elongatus]|uniref:hypothetical protein n=1 Tax=Desulfobulbus elongatus TaxID=53332 RepID=UPI000485E998|nr:hypothetical protein [Desulfobulbus elongatus]